ncbi:hypothetical protein LCGC14_0872380 [marine sediment metagenome]|uniref:DNA-directed DNA polymerase n=1 Tax=marine sediment metagenome TaxID=412755 RepID=A0A0F9RNY6_9ZZZZ
MSSNSRKPHILRPEKTLAIPRHVIFFDVESDLIEKPDGRTDHVLKLGWACYFRWGGGNRSDKETWFYFTTLDEFWDFVLSHCQTKNRLWVIAHKLPYDFTVVQGFRILTRHKFTVKFFYSKGLTTLIKVKGHKKSIIFVDSLNWVREPLAVIGERLGVPKLFIDFKTCSIPELKTYCKRDVLILLLMFKELASFLRSRSISRLCYTIGSTAMAAYLFGHYHHKIYIHNNQEALDLERDSYKGGRTECFYLGTRDDGPFFVVDVNSLYAFVMRGHLYPVKYEKYFPNMTIQALENALPFYTVIAQVCIDTDEPAYAIRKERTTFPVGQFWTTLTTPELEFALKRNHIKAVGKAVIYTSADIFKSYVDRFYRLRRDLLKEGKNLYDWFAKTLLNSLYGKFGQKGEIWQKIGVCPGEPSRVEICYDVDTKQRRKIRYLLGEVFEMTGSDETRHSFPAISSHVTAYARLYLYKLIRACGEKNYYYCDTDSLFVNRAGLENLADFMHDSRLGGLKIERESETMTIYGLKDYELIGKKVIKGISRHAEMLSQTSYRQEQWPTLQGLLSRAAVDQYYTTQVTKDLNRLYTKALVNKDGWTTPFVLCDDKQAIPALTGHVPELPFVDPSLL